MAIAATLLVLPLTEGATQNSHPTLSDIVSESGGQVLLLLLSFLVICRFWLVHHNIMRSLVTFDSPLFWANALWLLSIVLLPFTTNLIGTAASNDPATTGVYIGNMLVTCLAALVLQWRITRNPSLQSPASRGSMRLTPGIVTTVAMALALVLAITIPVVGPWGLLLLAFDGFVSRIIRRKGSTADDTTPDSPRR